MVHYEAERLQREVDEVEEEFEKDQCKELIMGNKNINNGIYSPPRSNLGQNDHQEQQDTLSAALIKNISQAINEINQIRNNIIRDIDTDEAEYKRNLQERLDSQAQDA